MSQAEVVLEVRSDPGEVGVIRASIRSPAWTRNAWFAAKGMPLRQDATPFVPAALLTAMQFDAPLRIEGAVSPRLLSNIRAVQAMFCVLRPRWRIVEVRAEAATVQRPAPTVGSFLSMGLDSLSLAIRKRDELTHLLMLRGFGAEPPAAAARIELGARELAERDGKELIFIESNIRELSRGVANWTRFHAAGLVGSAHAISPVIGEVVIASSMWRQEMVIYPSNPLLDPLWGSDETRIVHDGVELTRTEKAISLAGDELAMRYLHPCFVATGEEYNCGRCGKCLRTMASLRIAGVSDAPAFDRKLDLALLAAQPGTIPILDSIFRESLWGALTYAPDDTALIDAFRAAMTPPRSRIRRWRQLLERRTAT